MNKVEYPRGERIVNGVADAIMDLFTQSLAVQSRIDIDAILTTVSGAIAHRLPVTCIAVLMNPDPETSRVVFADETDPDIVRYMESYVTSVLRPGQSRTSGLSQRVIETGAPFFIPRMSFDQLFSMTSEEARQYRQDHRPPFETDAIGLLMVPMRSGPAIIGTLVLFDWHASDTLSDADIDWMQRLADRVGLSVESAQLRNKAMDRAERIAALSDVLLAITSSQDLRVTFTLLLERVVATLRVDAADILLVDETPGGLSVAASSGFRSGLSADVRGSMPSDVAKQWVVEHNIASPAAIEWISQSRRWMLAREGLKSYTAAPLVVREKFVGALEVFSRQALEPDREWLAFLDAMASEAAIAFDSKTMFDAQRETGQARTTRKSPAPPLTQRERQILALLVDGASNRDVAEKLHLSQNTIKFHVRQLLEKCGVANRTELATKAVHEGWA